MPASYLTFAAAVKRLDRVLAAIDGGSGRVGRAVACRARVVRSAAQQVAAAIRPAAAVGRGGRRRHEHRQVGDLQPRGRRSGQRREPAGCRHEASGVPDAAGLGGCGLLQKLFEPFALHPWQSADDPLADAPEHRLFWRAATTMPPRLLLLDAPDVDSDVTVNWQRARAIRQAADVLVAVLTQQKYNDAAVKQFFRAAVEADQPILVVFNQCDLEADREFWPQWLATFCDQTGARPELSYVIPYDRRGAEQLQLPFYRLAETVPIFVAGGHKMGLCPSTKPTPIPRLSALNSRPPPRPAFAKTWQACTSTRSRFARSAALRRVLDPQRGLPAYLQAIRAAAAEFSAAAAALSATEMARVGWPALPAGLLVDEIRAWWDVGRQEWPRRIHGFYRVIGRGVTWPMRTAWNTMAGPAADPLATFRHREREAVVLAVEKLLDELGRLAKVGNDTLRPRLKHCWAAARGPPSWRACRPRTKACPPSTSTIATFSAPNWMRGGRRTHGRCVFFSRSTTPRRLPGQPSPSACSSRACTSPAIWPDRPPRTPPDKPSAISPRRQPSPEASPAAARRWSAARARACAKPRHALRPAPGAIRPTAGPLVGRLARTRIPR